MNIRDNFLKSNLYHFEETDFIWHDNSVFRLNEIRSGIEKIAIIAENDIFLGLTKDPLIFLNDLKLLNSNINPDLLILASRHTSKTARPAFLVHTTGNWSDDTDFGGRPRDLSKASAILHKAGFFSLFQQEKLEELKNFSIDIEVTHHGPTLIEKPLIFMELGSSKHEWVIKEAGKYLANAIIQTVFKYLEFVRLDNQKIGLGFGGTHYTPNFNRLIRNANIAMSFICPKYYIQDLDKDLISKMINNTLEKVDYFIVDWKGTNSDDKKHLLPLLEDFKIPVKKTKDF